MTTIFLRMVVYIEGLFVVHEEPAQIEWWRGAAGGSIRYGGHLLIGGLPHGGQFSSSPLLLVPPPQQCLPFPIVLSFTLSLVFLLFINLTRNKH